MNGPGLSAHERESVEAVARFHESHEREATPLQRGIDAVTGAIGRPLVALLLLAAMAGWAALALARGVTIHDAAFAWLELSATLLALAVAVIILVTQRRENRLVERRAQLMLELALLSDRKNAKIIELMEELRRDAPDVGDRIDRESEDMKTPADPEAVQDAIDRRAP